MRSISILSGHFSGVRICRQPIYTPSYHDGSKLVQAKLSFPAMANSHLGGNGEGRKDTFRFTAWGGYADSIAVCGSIGQALDLLTTPQSYLGKLYDANDNLILRADGQPMLIEKVVFKIDKLCFGEESAKHVAEQIATGKRPAGWNNPASPDNATWKAIMAARRQHKWAKGDPLYGCAKVVLPSGNYTLAVDLPPQTAGAGAINTAVDNAGFPAAGTTEQAVHAVAGGLPAGQPAAPMTVSAGQQLF